MKVVALGLLSNVVLLLLITTIVTVRAQTTYTFIVSLKGIGHVNGNNYSGSQKFFAKKGNILCIPQRGCVGTEGTVLVKSNSNTMLLEVAATTDSYSISAMCSPASMIIAYGGCTATCSARDGYSSCSTPKIMEDAGGSGCAITGYGYSSETVQVQLQCESDGSGD